MSHSLPKLPYAYDALAPHISKKTLEIHHGKHHQAYVDKLNTLVKGTEFEKKTVDELCTDKRVVGGLFNQAAQCCNHEFYFNGLQPPQPEGKVNKPEGELL